MISVLIVVILVLEIWLLVCVMTLYSLNSGMNTVFGGCPGVIRCWNYLVLYVRLSSVLRIRFS